jgi:glycosyltransferase involved in cell wall biosynthesis
LKIPKITIVTPSYNQGQYLEQTILSVLGQQYPNLEYIIMDGGSSDNSVEIIRRYADKLAYWQSKPDRGQADAIAQGFAMSTSDVLGWLNSDDLLLPGALLVAGKTFSNVQRCIAVTGHCVYIDGNGCPFTVHVPRKRSWRSMLIWGHGLSQMATFWRRDTYEEVGGMDVSMKFSFDSDLFVRLRKRGSIEILPNYLAAFRFHHLSKTSTMLSTCYVENQIIIRRYGYGKFLPFGLYKLLRRADPLRRIENKIAWYRDKPQVRRLFDGLHTA